MSDVGYADNAAFKIPGVASRGRVIAACNRQEGAPSPVTLDGDRLRFQTMDRDASSTDLQRYTMLTAPKRAFVTFEPQGNMPERKNARLALKIKSITIEPGLPILENLFVVLAQYNLAPASTGIADRPPVMELGLIAINHLEADGSKMKNAAGVPLLFEHIELKVRRLVDGHLKTVYRVVSKSPIVRGQPTPKVDVAFKDGCGVNPGLAELYIGGVLQAPSFKGIIGYPGYLSPYLGLGVYSHNGQPPLAANFDGVWEGLKPLAA